MGPATDQRPFAGQRRRVERDEQPADPFVAFYHDVPRTLAEEAQRRERSESQAAYQAPWPLEAWPDVPTRFILCTEDRFFPPAFMRKVVTTRLCVIPEEIAAGHCVALSRPKELAELLVRSAGG